jgi:ubiquinone biosynthesis monooxygenase Coq7
MTQVLSVHLQRELRSDHAGETGAVYIYKGIVDVANWRNDTNLLSFAKSHGATEAEHLRQIEQWLPLAQRSLLLGPWRLAGWLTGALPAIFGRQSVYKTIAAVETFVDQHYQQQIDHIKSFGGPPELLSLLIKCQTDEQDHKNESLALAAQKSSVLIQAWCWLVGWGSAFAVVLARRI